jgi:hypothetical protein
MDFVAKPKKGGKVVILGAGASYGASLKHNPPIMRDFIKSGKKQVKYDYSKLWAFFEKLGYSSELLDSGSPNLEEIYTMLQIISKGLWYANEDDFINEIGKDFWKIPPVDLLESFIVEVINYSSMEALKRTCRYHDLIINSLSDGDTIISFNYDLIVDASLKKSGRWYEIGGYGFPYFGILKEHGEKFNTEQRSEISLLKLHGSLNWSYRKPSIRPIPKPANLSNPFDLSDIKFPSFYERLNNLEAGTQGQIEINPLYNLKERTFSGPLPVAAVAFYEQLAAVMPSDEMWKIDGVQKQNRDTFILPPGLNKFGNESVPKNLPEIWANANKALSLAKEVICIGYSFPNNDLEFNTLFRLSLSNNQNRRINIKIVNPDEGISEKIRQMVPRVKVTHVASTIKEFTAKM